VPPIPSTSISARILGIVHSRSSISSSSSSFCSLERAWSTGLPLHALSALKDKLFSIGVATTAADCGVNDATVT